MRHLNDLAVIGVVVGIAISVIGFFLYSLGVTDSNLFTNGLGIVFISAIVYMGTK